MKNRNPLKQWEITFPQTSLEREEFLEYLPPYEYAICAKEEHQNGGYHLHLGIKLLKGLSHIKLINFLKEKFPNDWKRIHVSVIKDWDNWINYCKKEDPNVVIKGSLAKRKSALQRQLEEMLEQSEGESWSEYLLRIRREDEENYNAYNYYINALPAWKRKWDQELMRLKNIAVDDKDYEYLLETYKVQKKEDFERFGSNWE